MTEVEYVGIATILERKADSYAANAKNCLSTDNQEYYNGMAAGLREAINVIAESK